MKEINLVTIDEYVQLHAGNVSEAAKAAGADYFTFRRWLKRTAFAPPNSSSRTLMAERGIDLPRRAARRKPHGH